MLHPHWLRSCVNPTWELVVSTQSVKPYSTMRHFEHKVQSHSDKSLSVSVVVHIPFKYRCMDKKSDHVSLTYITMHEIRGPYALVSSNWTLIIK